MTYPDEVDVEAPEADAAEQATSAYDRSSDGDDDFGEAFRDPEAPEWDVQEQHRVVDQDDDEYR